MRDFDDYLERLRAALDVTPKRAHEIYREVRTHLEAKSRELMATGLSEAEAVQEAVRGFGEPRRVAARLTEANDKYRRANQFGAALGFMFVFATMFTAPNVGALMTGTVLPLAKAQSLFQLLTMLPAAVLAGMVAGRRRWWVAGAAAVLWSTAFVMAVFPVFRDRSSWLPVKLHFIGDAIDVIDVIRTLMWGLVMAGCGYLGSRALGRGMVSWLVGVFCGGYVTLIGLFIPSVMVWGTIHVPGARPGPLMIQSVVAFSVVVLGALAYRDRRISA
jgi:ABC-type multidrug transport system fused ATPase/permease subunit